MLARGYCKLCSEALSGKQRIWCSSSCRKRYGRIVSGFGLESSGFVRESDANGRESSGFVRESDANGRESSGLVREPTQELNGEINQRGPTEIHTLGETVIKVDMTILYDSRGWNAEWDVNVIENRFRHDLGQAALDLLMWNYRWRFELVKCIVRRETI